jgi:hypothetical protein
MDVDDSSNMTSEVVSFIDNQQTMEDIPYNPDSVASSGATTDTSLASFLSRPTLINSLAWTTSTAVGPLLKIDPWYELMQNSVIKRKIENYAFIRAKLCLKFVVNASPFHFGMMRVSYEPNVNAANNGSRVSKIRSNPVSTYPLLTSYSQLPGVDLLPAANAGGVLKVPYFNHKSWARLTSAFEITDLGSLTYFVGVKLDVASATASPSILINTYAWLEDVELSGSTVRLALQAGDEYDGPISLPASALAKFSKQLESIPIISKFARATTIAAKAVAGVSSIFGFTNVPVISDIQAVIPLPYGALSTSEISTPVQKLTLDPKQELSIDPSITGVSSVDEMTIKSIISRPTILHVFDWTTTNTSGNVLANFRINPALYDSVNILDGSSAVKSYRIYHTWLSYLGMMFTHWRGDVVFEIEVIATKFHKGRLQISWDPSEITGAAQFPSNTAVTAILDIGESNKVEISVPFHQAYEWLRCRGITQRSWTINSANTPNHLFDNGLLVVSVLNPLISPVSPQEVHLIVRVKGGDNFEFANPCENFTESNSSPPPSFFAVQSLDEVDLLSTSVPFGDAGSKHVNRYDVNFGERVVSLRTLLRRYSLYDFSVTPINNTVDRLYKFNKSYTKLPPMYGFDPLGQQLATGLVNTAASFSFNAVPTHPITLIGMMYGALRGGVNYIINPSDGRLSVLSDTRVQRVTTDTYSQYRSGGIAATANTTDATSVAKDSFTKGFPTYAAGAAMTNGQTNGVLSVYYPQMSSTTFYYPDPTLSMGGNANDQTDRECILLDVILKPNGTAENVTRTFTVSSYAAIGTDFSASWLLCCPTLDYYVSAPVVTGP